MKRILVLLVAVLMLVCPLAVHSEEMPSAFSSLYKEEPICVEVGDKLLVIGEVDESSDADVLNDEALYNQLFSENQDMLRPYRALVLLWEKDGLIYIGLEFLLTDGGWTEGEGTALISTALVQEIFSGGN